MKGAGSAGREEELEFVKNIFIINKQGWKGAGEAAEDCDGQKDSGILAPSPPSDGFHLCLRRDILGSRWPSEGLSPGPSEVCVGHICKVHCLPLEVGEVGGDGGACNMGEGGQCPSHPRPEPPAQPVWTSIRIRTSQGPGAESGLGRRLALEEALPRRVGGQCKWGPTPLVCGQSMSSGRAGGVTWKCGAGP